LTFRLLFYKFVEVVSQPSH